MSVFREISKTFESQKGCNILCSMYGNPQTADVFFTCESSNDQQVRIPAHKSLLAQGSKVFYQMFFGEFKETGDVHLPDVSAEAFQEFLQFFYLNKIKLTNEYVAEVLYLSRKYDLLEPYVICANFLEQILDSQSMCWGYELAILYDLKHLSSFCEKEICFDTKSILKSESFKNCSRHILKRIVLMNDLNCEEIEVFDACMRWAEFSEIQHETTNGTSSKRPENDELSLVEKQKLQLGECFDLIRFPTMTADQFLSCLENRDCILTADEIADIKQHIANGCPLVAAKRFNDNVRLWKAPLWSASERLCCHRFRYESNDAVSDDDDFYYLDYVGSFKMSSNKRIILAGMDTNRFDVCKYKNVCSLKAKFEIWTKADNSLPECDQLLISQLAYIQSNYANYIDFFGTVILNPRQIYEIRITFLEDQWYQPMHHAMHIHANFEQLQSKVNLKHGIEIEFNEDEDKYKDCYNITGNLISDLYIVPIYTN